MSPRPRRGGWVPLEAAVLMVLGVFGADRRTGPPGVSVAPRGLSFMPRRVAQPAPALPQGWRSAQDMSGRTYYYHTVRDRVQC